MLDIYHRLEEPLGVRRALQREDGSVTLISGETPLEERDRTCSSRGREEISCPLLSTVTRSAVEAARYFPITIPKESYLTGNGGI